MKLYKQIIEDSGVSADPLLIAESESIDNLKKEAQKLAAIDGCIEYAWLPWPLGPSPALCAQPLIPALGPVQKAFTPFGPPALVQQAPPAIILAALRHFRGPAVFLGLRTSSSLGAPFWPSGLTLRSSGPAFCGPLTLAVRRHI